LKSVCIHTLGLIVLAAMLGGVLYKVASKTNEEYAARWPLQGDTISYWSRDIALAHTILNPAASHRVQALAGAVQNGKDPLRTAFYALLPAEAPAELNGHLAFSAFSAFLFLAALMLMLHRRSGSLPYAVSGAMLALLPAGLLNPLYGLPSKLPDMPASFLFGAAIFAAFSARDSKRSELTCFFIAGLLLGLATMARFQLWIYGLFVLGPIVSLFGLKRYLTSGRQWVDLLVYPGVLVAGLALLAGPFILAWTREMLQFYAIAGYSLNSTVLASLKTTGAQFLQYLGIPALLAGTLIFAAYVALNNDERKGLQRWNLIAITWVLAAYPILLFLVMRVEAIIEQAYYIVPGLLVFLLSPFVRNTQARNGGFKTFALALMVVLPLGALGNAYQYLQSENFLYPREREAEIAKFQHKLGDLVAANIAVIGPSSRPSVIDSNFFYYSRFIELVARNRFDRDAKSRMVFEIRQSQWQLSHTGDLVKDKALIMKELGEMVDVFMALTKPLHEAKAETFVDDYTEQMALYVNSELAAHPENWENKGTVVGPFGEVTVYRNRIRSQ
jgi:hypothetical protein